jgi:isopenicillin N synthase-like dioxygenase
MSSPVIPTISLELCQSSSSEIRSHQLAKLREALASVGFLYLADHGIPSSVVSNMEHMLPEFFSLPASVKAEIDLEKSPHFLGYSGVGSENTAGQADGREQVEFGTELPQKWTPENGADLWDRLVGPNQV